MMNRFKKTVASILAVSMICASFAGCSGKSSGAASSTAAPGSAAPEAKPVTVEFWTISLQPTFTDFFNGLIKTYESENKNVKIKWVDLPYDAIQQKLITASAGGTSPDVVNLNTQMALTLAGKNALVDLHKEATDEQKGIYIDTIYNSTKIGESVYAFPWYASPSVMIYNKALFEKAGLTSTPKTYEEAFKLAKTMKDKTGAYMYVPEELTQILFLDDLDILSADKKKAAFNNANTLGIINQYKPAVVSGELPKSNWGKWDNSLKLFETGKLAIINSSGSSIARIKDEAPDVYKNIGIAQPMVGKAGISLNPLMNLVVPTASKNHKEAIAFANFITNDANQLEFCKKVAIFPSTKKAAADSYFKSDSSTLEGIARGICADTLPKSADIALGVEKQGDIQTAINKIYEASIMGNTEPQKAISDVEAKVNTILAGQ
jgi:putative chitobiose transport system substrate-binding protein